MKSIKAVKILNTFYDFAVALVILGAVVMCVLPVLHVASLSLSSNSAIINDRVTVLPVEITFKSYAYILSDLGMWQSLFVTVVVTLIYTVLGMALTALGPLVESALVAALTAARSRGPGRIRLVTRLEQGSMGSLQKAFLTAVGARPQDRHAGNIPADNGRITHCRDIRGRHAADEGDFRRQSVRDNDIGKRRTPRWIRVGQGVGDQIIRLNGSP